MHDLSHHSGSSLGAEPSHRARFLRRGTALLATLLMLFGLSTAVAVAAEPEHFMFSETGTFGVAAGDLCDFAYDSAWRVEINGIAFGDQEIVHFALFKSHTNLDTGYTLTEVDHFTDVFEVVKERVKQVGVFWHLRDPSGKLVVVQAGALFFDTSTGDVRVTPNFDPDFAAVVCPALGGSVAS